jgi:hypothetical protein
MKISPVPSAQSVVTTNPETPARASEVRTIRMATNATPLRMAPPSETPVPGSPSTTKVGIPDPNDPAQRQPEATEPLSPQLAALARQRRALQVKERELTARETALKSQPATQAGGIDLARLKAEPLSVLQEAGITYDQLAQAVLQQQNGVNPEQLRAIEAKLAALETGFEKKLTDRDQQGRAEALKAMTGEAQTLVAQGEEFELVRETQSVPDAIRLIERIYDQTGEVKDVRWALAEIETELVKDILKVAGLKKVQGQLQPQAAAPAQATQSRPAMRTLANRDTASPPMTAKQRALAAFWGQPVNR